MSVFAIFVTLNASACQPPTDVRQVEPTEQKPQATVTKTVVTTATPMPTEAPTLTPTSTRNPNAITNESAQSLERIVQIEDVRFGRINAIAVSPDGLQVATGSDDRMVRVFLLPTGDLLHELAWHDGAVTMLAYSPDGMTLVSGSQDRTIQIWQPIDGERVTGFRIASEPAQVAFDPIGDRFSYAGLFSALGETRSVADGTALYQLEGHKTRLRSIAQSKNGVWIATGDRLGKIVLHGAQSGQPAFSLETGISADVQSLAFSPDSNLLAVGLSTGQIQLWNVIQQHLINEWVAHSNGTRSLLFTIDGTVVISGGADAGLRLWDISSGERIVSYPEHNGAVNSLSMSAEGTLLASASDDSSAIIWAINPN